MSLGSDLEWPSRQRITSDPFSPEPLIAPRPITTSALAIFGNDCVFHSLNNMHTLDTNGGIVHVFANTPTTSMSATKHLGLAIADSVGTCGSRGYISELLNGQAKAPNRNADAVHHINVEVADKNRVLTLEEAATKDAEESRNTELHGLDIFHRWIQL